MAAMFDIPWIAASRFSIQFKTDIDAEYTAHEQRNALWSNPRYKWSILVPKNTTNFHALLNFFSARKGRWNAFNFTWASDKQGDGRTYLVRFDCPEDELIFASDDGENWIIPIVQVVNSGA